MLCGSNQCQFLNFLLYYSYVRFIFHQFYMYWCICMWFDAILMYVQICLITATTRIYNWPLTANSLVLPFYYGSHVLAIFPASGNH